MRAIDKLNELYENGDLFDLYKIGFVGLGAYRCVYACNKFFVFSANMTNREAIKKIACDMSVSERMVYKYLKIGGIVLR
jgi:hypothetical protein